MLRSFKEEFNKIEEEYRVHMEESHDPLQDSLRKKLAEPYAKFVVFGAGVTGFYVAATMSGLKEKLIAFCDNYKTGYNERFQVPIISPEKLLADHRDAQIIVACHYTYNSEIYNQLMAMGFDAENVFRVSSQYALYDINELKAHYEGYQWAYNFFQDGLSKRIILDRLRNYLYYSKMDHSPCADQYFEDVQFTEHEIFVDGGFYTGDTASEFIQRVNGRYDAIYGFEPDAENYETAKANLEQYQRIYIMNKGLWDKNEMLSFFPEGASSKVDSNGTVSISLTSLDEFFSDKKELPTFIKMDIEGAEKKALIGAEKIIRAARPKLAICVYHKPEDIYELPSLIMKFDNSYHFTLRHYTPGMWETVLYAL